MYILECAISVLKNVLHKLSPSVQYCNFSYYTVASEYFNMLICIINDLYCCDVIRQSCILLNQLRIKIRRFVLDWSGYVV